MTAKVTAAAKPKKAPAPAKAKSTTTKAKTATKKTTTKAKSAKPAAKHAVPDAHQLHLAHLAHLKAEGKAGFAIGDLLPVCSFEAVAQSARLAGARIHDDDVGGLWSRLGERPDGASVGDAIAAAALFGLGGFRPLKAVPLSGELRELGDEFGVDLLNDLRGSASRPVAEFLVGVHGLILHVDVPGPHAVLATRDGWWSWGELFSPWPARVSEAWAVSWS